MTPTASVILSEAKNPRIICLRSIPPMNCHSDPERSERGRTPRIFPSRHERRRSPIECLTQPRAKPRPPLAPRLRSHRPDRRRQIRVPRIRHRLPATVGLLLPDRHIFASVVYCLALRHLRRHRVRTNVVHHVAGLRSLHPHRSPRNIDARNQQIHPGLLHARLVRKHLPIRRQDNGIIGVIPEDTVHVMRRGRLRPLHIRVPNRLFRPLQVHWSRLVASRCKYQYSKTPAHSRTQDRLGELPFFAIRIHISFLWPELYATDHSGGCEISHTPSRKPPKPTSSALGPRLRPDRASNLPAHRRKP